VHPDILSKQLPYPEQEFLMRVFILGITGGIGGALGRRLTARGDSVTGLIRSIKQQETPATQGIDTYVGDLSSMTTGELAVAFRGSDAVVFAAGSNGGSKPDTKAVDGEGVAKALEAAHDAGVDRFILVSVLPESWRERNLDEDLEYYFAIKKQADIAVSRSKLAWVILRPSLLTDDPATGIVSLGPAELHEQISRNDVATTLVELLHEPRITRQILELNTGSMPIKAAVQANVRADPR
jgi:uncharacterized protein YbjT (DUF2867 family)